MNETSIALRPFFFTVHPDLFGRFPKEQAVNEHSIKLLNEYIEKLNSRQEVLPVSLVFFLRNAVQSSNNNQPIYQRSLNKEAVPDNFRPIQLKLAAKTLNETVRAVLSACSLPLSYVESVRPAASGSNPRQGTGGRSDGTKPDGDEGRYWQTNADTLHWFHDYGIFSEFQTRRRSKDTLNEWLKKNVLKAHKYNLVTRPIRQEIRRLKECLQDETGVADVLWDSEWTIKSYRTALKGLLRICRANPTEIDLKGRKVIFGNETGVCIHGNVILRYDDVPDRWISILTSLQKHDGTIYKIPSVEKYLSHLLNDVQIVSRSHLPVVLADDYLRQLKKLIICIQEHKQKDLNQSKIHAKLDDVELVVECATGPLMISQSGQILVPSSCPAFLIVDFLNANASKARQIYTDFKRTEIEHRDVVGRCHSVFGLESLTQDRNITHVQMVSCCDRLVRMSYANALNVDLTSCYLKITQFYSVMSDGDICIPWNFEDFV